MFWFISVVAFASDPLPLSFEKTPLDEVIAMFTDASGIRVEVLESSNPLISLDRMASDYDEAIKMIASAASLAAVKVGDVYRLQNIVRNHSVLVVELRHREAQQVLDLLAKSNTQFGNNVSVIADPETNRLILRGSQSELSSIKDFIQVFDIEVKQILIEAKLVSQDVDKRRDLGIRWSFATSEAGRSGAQGQTIGLGGESGRSALSLAFVSDPKLLALELQALESSGVGEVISEPRIVTTNRRAATIRQGQQLPFVTVDEEGRTTTEFKDAVLELKVTPVLRDDGRIEMTLDIRQDQVGQLSTQQGPIIETRELNTRVTVDPAETLVLGGIYESKEENITVGVPGLSSIPLLGHAFQSSQRRAFKSELLIFITPRVL
jgi:type IV pilus assembly protein PilQ